MLIHPTFSGEYLVLVKKKAIKTYLNVFLTMNVGMLAKVIGSTSKRSHEF